MNNQALFASQRDAQNMYIRNTTQQHCKTRDNVIYSMRPELHSAVSFLLEAGPSWPVTGLSTGHLRPPAICHISQRISMQLFVLASTALPPWSRPQRVEARNYAEASESQNCSAGVWQESATCNREQSQN